MRITRVLTLAAVASLLMMQPHATPAMAQNDPAAQGGKSDSQPLPPPGLGPRKNAQGQAQAPGQRPLPKVDNMGTFGKWNVQCAEVPASPDAEAGRSCGMTQQNKSEKNDKVAISVIVNKVKRGDKSALFMRIMTPIGVYLPTGIPVEIDGNALPSRLIYTRCVPPICEAMGEMSPDTLAKFKKGGASVFYLYDRPGNGYPIKISLDGFGAAAAELDKY